MKQYISFGKVLIEKSPVTTGINILCFSFLNNATKINTVKINKTVRQCKNIYKA